MKKLIAATVLLLVLAALPFSHLLMAGKMAKFDICHKGKIINVNGNSLGGHFGHGDCLADIFACDTITNGVNGCFCRVGPVSPVT